MAPAASLSPRLDIGCCVPPSYLHSDTGPDWPADGCSARRLLRPITRLHGRALRNARSSASFRRRLHPRKDGFPSFLLPSSCPRETRARVAGYDLSTACRTGVEVDDDTRREAPP